MKVLDYDTRQKLGWFGFAVKNEFYVSAMDWCKSPLKHIIAYTSLRPITSDARSYKLQGFRLSANNINVSL